MNYWLCKSEPSVYSIDDLKKDKTTLWDSIRNYQARNFMKEMKAGDLVLFYHSNADPMGISGVMKVSKEAIPDPTQFDKKNNYYDEKATKDKPRWFCPEMKFVKKFKEIVTRDELKAEKGLSEMVLLQKGSRLSVNPVTKKQYEIILKMAGA